MINGDYVKEREIQKSIMILQNTVLQVNRVLYNWNQAGKEKSEYNIQSLFRSYLSRSCLKYMNYWYYQQLQTKNGPRCTIEDNKLTGIFIENGATGVEPFRQALENFNFNNPKYFIKEQRKKDFVSEINVSNLVNYNKINSIKF